MKLIWNGILADNDMAQQINDFLSSVIPCPAYPRDSKVQNMDIDVDSEENNHYDSN
ncbi:hypothetical protein MERGE_000763 [Pneumocystis wakefieldiae]|uniref:Uncharacterized protein n=1 Tax=Pneumocystis wakefieldiae TaxID=38082 RepID=A0A899G1F5_9ASCO|nr:hypothetical protein MERGE_000763 [Pneumocystis wakefieldiae]